MCLQQNIDGSIYLVMFCAIKSCLEFVAQWFVHWYSSLFLIRGKGLEPRLFDTDIIISFQNVC